MKTPIKVPSAVVNATWLNQNLQAPNLIVLNGTMPKVGQSVAEVELENQQIPEAVFFDIKKMFSLQNAPFPNTIPEVEVFEASAQKIGICEDSCIVVYDEHGIYSSPRVWWLFKTMGFDNIAVLDGGLPVWSTQFKTEQKRKQKEIAIGDFKANYRPQYFRNTHQILENINNGKELIIDARSSGRFTGLDPEPRTEIRSGHIPYSKNLPFGTVLNEGNLHSIDHLEKLFHVYAAKSDSVVFSCGSGITACILMLAATSVGYEKVAIYDGSWTEWGSLLELPIEI